MKWRFTSSAHPLFWLWSRRSWVRVPSLTSHEALQNQTLGERPKVSATARVGTNRALNSQSVGLDRGSNVLIARAFNRPLRSSSSPLTRGIYGTRSPLRRRATSARQRCAR